ncbi:MAG TPA: glycosyltransferase family 87 protein [Chloroflexota bacterium]|nr:glycosyltransferase family 87 protein [Chloroflexota bacterium]
MQARTTGAMALAPAHGTQQEHATVLPTNQRRIIGRRLRWLIGAVLVWALIYLLLYVPAGGNGSDFQDFYVAAYADAHGIDVYSWPAIWRAEQLVYNGGVGHLHPFNFVPYGNPPPFALLLRPLTALPESTAYLLWAVLIVVTMACGAYLGLPAWPRAQRLLATAMVTLSPAALFNVRLGQSASLLLLGLGLALWLLHRRQPGLAGAALTIGLVKPHLILPVALILIVAAPREQRRPAIYGVLAGAAAWVVVAMAADGGIGVFGRWWASIHDYIGTIRLQPDVASIPGFYYSSAPAGMIGPLNGICLLAAFAMVTALAWYAWRVRGGDEHARALLFGGGIAAYFALSPYVHTGDQVVLALPLLALIGPTGQGIRQNAVLLAATVALVAPITAFRDYHTEGINALPPLCLGLAYLLWEQARRRARDPGAAPVAVAASKADG